MGSTKVHNGVEASVHSDQLAYLPNSKKTTSHVGLGADSCVVSDAESLTFLAENRFDGNHKAG